MAALQAPQAPAHEVALTDLINEIAEHSGALLLVLDDYHLITSRDIHQALGFLVENLPQTLHVALATRSDPPLPLPILRAKGQLTELRLADLRFTPQEAATFLRDVVGLDLSSEDLRRLEERTEGWIAGLQLAALSMRGRNDLAGFVKAFSGSHRYVLDYLAEEVLNRQPEAVQEFLLGTSILNRLSGPLSDAVTGGRDGQQMLERLEDANLFVLPLVDERPWYRYHRLFADLLRTRLEDGPDVRVSELHLRASLWFEESGAMHDAIGHAIDAGDAQRLRHLVEMHGMPMLMRGELTTLLGWISSLPEDAVVSSPVIGTLHAWALLLTGQMQLLESRLQQVERALDKAQPGDLSGQVAAIRAYQAAQFGDAARTVQVATAALSQLSDQNEEIRSVVLFVLGGAHLLGGDLDAARNAMAEAGAMGTRAGNIHLAVPALNALAGILLLQGQLEAASEAAKQAVALATTPSGQLLPSAGGALSSLAELAYERDELDKALEHAQRGIELGERWGNQDTLISGYVTLAQVLQGRQQLDEASEAMKTAERLARSAVITPAMRAVLRGARGRLLLAFGSAVAAQRWAGETPVEPVHPMRVSELLTLARMHISQGSLAAAGEVLDPLLQVARGHGMQAVLIEALTLEAMRSAAGGEETAALAALTEALWLGESEGFVRRFVDVGPPLDRLLRLAGSHGLAGTYVKRLLRAFTRLSERSTGQSQAEQPLLDPLSERELEVLRLIAEGLSNREIAGRLHITVATVKSHANHIFSKLAVRSRTEAAARARDLSLL
jgi:LuxR family maltose regulon positive regulatory protein